MQKYVFGTHLWYCGFVQVHQSPDGKEGADAGNGASTGTVVNGTSSKPKDALPYNVIAIGSQDCCISVWTTGSPRPVFIGKHFFTQSVVDLSWCIFCYMICVPT
jgi:hypothetical protein